MGLEVETNRTLICTTELEGRSTEDSQSKEANDRSGSTQTEPVEADDES